MLTAQARSAASSAIALPIPRAPPVIKSTPASGPRFSAIAAGLLPVVCTVNDALPCPAGDFVPRTRGRKPSEGATIVGQVARRPPLTVS